MEKREVGLVEGLKAIYNEADRQGAFDSVKEKLLSKARIKKESGNTESNAFGPEANTDKKNVKADTDKKNINISAGGFKPNLTDIANYNPNVNVSAKLGGDEGFYADAGAGASLQGGVNYNAEAGYKGKNMGINVNLGQGNINVEGKKQLNKYLDLTGSADTSGNYRAGIGFDFKF